MDKGFGIMGGRGTAMKTIMLEITKLEGDVLERILNQIEGDPVDSHRKEAAAILQRLRNAGCDGNKFYGECHGGNISFLNYIPFAGRKPKKAKKRK
jgi:hypothetical protein